MANLKKGQKKFLDLAPTSAQRKKLTTTFNRVLSSGNFILGEEVKKFEKNFAQYLGNKFCIGVGNGLEAIQISLMSLGIKNGDEIITTPISAVATTLAILAVGAKPVFVDTTSDGLINPDLILQAVTKKTKAILPVHLYGNAVEVDKIQAICKKYNLFLIEDAAQAHGSTYKSKKLGTFGIFGCFSFYPTKNLAAYGDGGAIVTNNSRLARICREIRDYGQSGKYLHSRYGLNSRLDEIQAAFLSIKLGNLDQENIKRQTLAKRYIKNLTNIDGLEIVKPDHIGNCSFHLFVIKTKKRKQLMEYLNKQDIQTLIHYPLTIADQPFLKREYGKTSLPIARDFVKKCLSLPCYSKMNLSDVNFVSSKINNFFKKQS